MCTHPPHEPVHREAGLKGNHPPAGNPGESCAPVEGVARGIILHAPSRGFMNHAPTPPLCTISEGALTRRGGIVQGNPSCTFLRRSWGGHLESGRASKEVHRNLIVHQPSGHRFRKRLCLGGGERWGANIYFYVHQDLGRREGARMGGIKEAGCT